MNKIFTERPLVKTGIFGLLLLPLLIVINELSPSGDKIPDGYSSAILAFEFVSNPEELNEVLSPLSMAEKRDLDYLNYVDFGFMSIYGIFLFLLMARLGTLMNSSLLSKAKWLGPLIVLFDALENVQLLKLNNSISFSSELNNSILCLGIFTWLKWGLLSIAFAVVGYLMTKMKKSKWLGYILLLPSIIGVLSFFSGQRILEDSFGSSVFLSFFLLFLYCFIYKMPQRGTT